MITLLLQGKLPSGITKHDLMDLVEQVCRRTKKRGDISVAIRVVADAAMRRLNRQFRGKDAVTDVLSFAETNGTDFVSLRESEEHLGDIMIDLPQVRRQAKAIGRDTASEFALMIVHGTLHLLGFDHESLSDEKKMFALQQEILMRVGWM